MNNEITPEMEEIGVEFKFNNKDYFGTWFISTKSFKFDRILNLIEAEVTDDLPLYKGFSITDLFKQIDSARH